MRNLSKRVNTYLMQKWFVLWRLKRLFLRGKRKLKVDLGELEREGESLSSFLRSKLKADVSLRGDKLFVDSDFCSPSELMRLVNKFVYHRNLNHTYWVALEDNVVKLHKFKRSEKKGKQKKGTIPSTIKHGW
jgi:hypothetical protein